MLIKKLAPESEERWRIILKWNSSFQIVNKIEEVHGTAFTSFYSHFYMWLNTYTIKMCQQCDIIEVYFCAKRYHKMNPVSVWLISTNLTRSQLDNFALTVQRPRIQHTFDMFQCEDCSTECVVDSNHIQVDFQSLHSTSAHTIPSSSHSILLLCLDSFLLLRLSFFLLLRGSSLRIRLQGWRISFLCHDNREVSLLCNYHFVICCS